MSEDNRDDHCTISKLWTSLGWTLIALFIPFIFYIRGGNNIFGSSTGSEALQITMAGWGILAFGIGFSGLAALGLMYIKNEIKPRNTAHPWPANTMHEAPKNRNIVISTFFLALFTGIPLISACAGIVRYSNSYISEWSSKESLAVGFFASRIEAFKHGCLKQPCYRIHPQDGHEYILYLTDGILIFVVLLCITLGSVWLVKVAQTLKCNNAKNRKPSSKMKAK